MNKLYYFEDITFSDEAQYQLFARELHVAANDFQCIAKDALSSKLIRWQFTKHGETIQLYTYETQIVDGYFDVLFFIEYGEFMRDFISRMTPTSLRTKNFQRDIFLPHTSEALVIEQKIEAYFERFRNDTRDMLHIYGQRSWHQEAFIVGNRAALKQLQLAIGEALENGEMRETFFPSDEEGYDVYIACVDDAFDFETLDLPYHDEELFNKPKPPLKAFTLYGSK
ncbi:hypothetical protein [Caryophanon latum]|nr:hypothetical protein [Caryophanon latum]